MCYPYFLLFKYILEIAFENFDGKMCVPRQVAHITGIDIVEVSGNLEVVAQKRNILDWQAHGATPAMVFEFCQMHGFWCAIAHNGLIVDRLEGDLGKTNFSLLSSRNPRLFL